MSTRAERIIDHAREAKAVIERHAKWHNCALDSGLTLSTQVAILDSRAIYEIRSAIDELIAEAHKQLLRDRRRS